MIGVLCNENEREIVEEFFELFKTPWEFFAGARNYAVVISTVRDTPAVDARLVILYSSKPTRFDTLDDIAVASMPPNTVIRHNGMKLPIYGAAATFGDHGRPVISCNTSSRPIAIGFSKPQGEILRIGYDLFFEISCLLTEGQPPENALIPTLELHISLLRDWIVRAGIPLVEIPPVPYGRKFIACLTHDVDFGGIRLHKLDHTMWGFVYRALVGSLFDIPKGIGSFGRLLKNWSAVLSLPQVYMGMRTDFWDDFERYIQIEGGIPSTFFFIPFKDKAGDNVIGEFPARRAARYDIGDVRVQVENLIKHSCEIGLHGIDAWHNVVKGTQELNRITEVTGEHDLGVRIHWLCFDRHSPAILDQAGFKYDSTVGYNETIGYRAGTTQVFKPLEATQLLELPLHIQDTALFYPRRLASTPAQAWSLCENILHTVARFGGVVTVLWHQRSLAPERFWDEFYIRLLEELKSQGAWFGTAAQVVRWFRQRRSVVFEECTFEANRLHLHLKHVCTNPGSEMILRVHRPWKLEPIESKTEQPYTDIPLSGESSMDIPLADTELD